MIIHHRTFQKEDFLFLINSTRNFHVSTVAASSPRSSRISEIPYFAIKCRNPPKTLYVFTQGNLCQPLVSFIPYCTTHYILVKRVLPHLHSL